MSHGKFKYESSLASDDVAGYLESLATGIRQREVRFESGNDSVSLHLADDVSFEFSASEHPEKGHTGFALSVEWRAASHDGARSSPGMHVTPGSMVEEQGALGAGLVSRPALILAAPVVKRVSDTDPSNAAPRRVNKRRTKAATRKPAAPTKIASRAKATSAARRSHARRRVAS